MQLTAVTTKKGRAKAQAKLQRSVEALPSRDRRVTFRPTAMNVTISTLGPGRLWASCDTASEAGVLRHRNWFGILPEDEGNLAITVQCNVPIGAADSPVHGFYAREHTSGRTYLMHDGTLGGGVKGVGRHAFLEWVGSDPVEVQDAEDVRIGLVVADLDGGDVPLQIEEFVRRVARFKELARTGSVLRTNPPSLLRLLSGDEYVGTKSGARGGVVDYQTYHGAIVLALIAESAAELGDDVEVGRTRLIDVVAVRAGRLVEVYEVKPSLDRQSLYTAIGQLIVLGGVDPKVRRTIVLPQGDLPMDVAAGLTAHGIAVRRFQRSDRTGRIKLMPAEA